MLRAFEPDDFPRDELLLLPPDERLDEDEELLDDLPARDADVEDDRPPLEADFDRELPPEPVFDLPPPQDDFELFAPPVEEALFRDDAPLFPPEVDRPPVDFDRDAEDDDLLMSAG